MDSVNKLKQLESHMRQNLTRWERKGVFPSLQEISGATKSWKDTLSTLDHDKAVQSSELQSAIKSIDKAWDHRDNREEAQENIRKSYRAIKSLVNNIDDLKENVRFSGYDDQGRKVNAYSVKEITAIKSVLSGLTHKNRFNDSDSITLRDISFDLRNLMPQYVDQPNVLNYINSAIDSINNGSSSIKSHALAGKSNISRAIDALDRAEKIIINKQIGGSQRKLNLSQKESLQDSVAMAQLAITQADEPISGSYKAIQYLSNAYKRASNHGAYKSARKIEKAIDYLQAVIANTPKIKARIRNGANPWGNENVQKNIEAFLDTVVGIEQAIEEE